MDKKFPISNDFSPGAASGLFELRVALELVGHDEVGKSDLRDQYRDKWFSDHAEGWDEEGRLKSQRQQAGHVISGMTNYGLLPKVSRSRNAQVSLTELGRELLDSSTDEQMYDLLAAHILLNLHGLELIAAVRNLEDRTIEVTPQSLADELRLRGFKLPNATTDHTRVVQWLRLAGVIGNGFSVVDEKVDALVGRVTEVLQEWASLTQEQRWFLEIVRELCPFEAIQHAVPTIVERMKDEKGSKVFPRDDQIGPTILEPLRIGGWITRHRRSVGHGARSGNVSSTRKLLDFRVAGTGNDAAQVLPVEVRTALAQPIDQLFDSLLGSQDASTTALEALAVKLAQDIGLRNLHLERRTSFGQGNEARVFADSLTGLHHSKWLVMVRNSASVDLVSLKTELEEFEASRINVLVLVVVGEATATVQEHFRQRNNESHQQMILLNIDDLLNYRKGGQRALQLIFARAAEERMNRT